MSGRTCLNRETSRQTGRREGKVGSTRAIVIRGRVDFLYHLIIRITEGKRHLLGLDRLMTDAIDHAIDYGRGMQSLTWPINRPVGINHRLQTILIIFCITITIASVQYRTSLVSICIRKGLIYVVIALEEIFALRIRRDLMRLFLVIRDAFTKGEMRIGNRLTSRRTDHHITNTILRLRFCHQEDIRHEIQTAAHCSDLLRRELQHIDTHRQSFEWKTILEEFIVLMPCIRTLHLLHHGSHQRFDLLEVIVVIGIQVDVTLRLEGIDLHRKLGDIAQRPQLECLRTHGHNHPTVGRDLILRLCQSLAGIPQTIETFPTGPFIQRLTDIVEFLLGRRPHPIEGIIPFDGHLTTYRQIAIGPNE